MIYMSCNFFYYHIQPNGCSTLIPTPFYTPQNFPPISDESSILLESAVCLAHKIRNQQPGFSSVDAVKAYKERIQQVNGIINAVVDTR